jgi:hypothetical protein
MPIVHAHVVSMLSTNRRPGAPTHFSCAEPPRQGRVRARNLLSAWASQLRSRDFASAPVAVREYPASMVNSHRRRLRSS